MSEPCVDCDDQYGPCHWAGCDFEADYAINEVTVRHRGTLINVGTVRLCGGHMQRYARLGRLELDWDLVLKALT